MFPCRHFGLSLVAPTPTHQLAAMAKWQATPFAIKRALVLEGGWLQAPWVLETQVVDGGEYIALLFSDRSLAKALGMNMSMRSPLAQCSIFAHMASVRDDHVDTLIHAAKVNNDPMADASASTAMGPMPSRGRALAFVEAGLPNTVALKFPAFVTADGTRVKEIAIRLVTTPKRKAHVTMEATPENFEWLVKAAHEDWGASDRPPKMKRTEDDEQSSLPVLKHPCKYHKTAGGKTKIVCSYRDQGIWKRHQNAVEPYMGKDSSFEDSVRKCESDVLDFYEKNHEPSGESGAAASEPQALTAGDKPSPASDAEQEGSDA